MEQKQQAELPKEAQKQPMKLTRTQLLPFSFDVRDQRLKQKKEEYIKNVYEEEKKAREFHARPIPKAILQSSKNKSGNFSSDIGKNLEMRSKTVGVYSLHFSVTI